MLRALFKDSAIYVVPAIISRGLAVLLLPLYTRVLSPVDYGSLDLLIVFASIVNLTISLEVSQGVARFYAGEQDRKRKITYASTAFWFTLVCYSTFAALMLSFTDSMASRIMGQPGLERAFQIGIIYIWINSLFSMTQNQFRWELRSKNYAIVSLMMSVITAGVSILLAYKLRWGLEGLLIGMVAGNLIGVWLGLRWLSNSIRFCFDLAHLRDMLIFSTPLVFSGVAVWVSLYIDRIMINHFLSLKEVGLYGIGYRLASIASLILVGFQTALTPLIYTHHHKMNTPHEIAQIFRLFISFALMMFLGLSLFSADILRLVSTEPFYDARVVIPYLVPAVLFSNMYIFSPGISITKRTHYFIWINTAGSILNVALNYSLIPHLGIQGAGLATMVSYLAVFIMHMTISQRLYYVPYQWRPILIPFLITSMFMLGLLESPLTGLSRWSLNLVAIGTLAGVSVASGLIKTSELCQAGALVKNIALSRSSSPPDMKE